MKTIAAAAVALCLVASPAWASKSCEELKSEIATKLEAKGVQNPTLEIVANEDVKDQKVVGSCDGGTKKITYKRGEAKEAESPKPGA
jgi:Protein of unknown function (DUF1161)